MINNFKRSYLAFLIVMNENPPSLTLTSITLTGVVLFFLFMSAFTRFYFMSFF